MAEEAWAKGLPPQLREIAGLPVKLLSVLSGPGTGKTWALVRRAARFLEEAKAPTRILFVTFTRTAADDLRRKIGQLEHPQAGAIDAGTLHSLAFRILNASGAFQATGRVPRPLMKYEEDCLLRDLPGKMKEKRERLAAFEAAWARLDHESPSGWPIEDADKQFQQKLLGWLTFHRGILLAELIPVALSYLRQEPTSEYLNHYEHVLVDEYQDLNRAEQVLIDILAGNQATLSAIGDDDQSIYTTFRNAHPEGIVNFPYRHAGTDARTLDLSMRCPPNIVAMANAFLTHPDMQRLTDRLIKPDETKPNANVHIVRWNTLDREIDGLARFIRWYCENNECGPGDVLVLSPRRQIGYRIRERLRELGIPAMSFFHEEALDNEQAQCKFTLLRLLIDTEDRVAFRHWLSVPSQLLGAYGRVVDHCLKAGDSPWVTMTTVANGSLELRGATDTIRARFVDLQAKLGSLTGLIGMDFVNAWLGDEREDAESRLSELRAMCQRIVSHDENLTPAALRDQLLDEISQPELPVDIDCVRIMSLHKSKGLTAKVVVITGLAAGMIPFVPEGLTPAEETRCIQEQRRLFFVAMTRATDYLLLSSAKLFRPLEATRMGLSLPSYGPHWRRTAPSPFATQLGQGAPAKASEGDGWLAEHGVADY